jgi:hypothetical protein
MYFQQSLVSCIIRLLDYLHDDFDLLAALVSSLKFCIKEQKGKNYSKSE